VHPAVRGLAPLVAGVVALARGTEKVEGQDLRAQIEQALTGLAERAEWRALAAALTRVVAGERDREALVAGLDPVDTALVDLALEALAGNAGAQARLARLVQEAQEAHQDQAQEIQQAFEEWLASPFGHEALRELQAQGLADVALVQALLARFSRSQGLASPGGSFK
jgi:hypothetical protein